VAAGTSDRNQNAVGEVVTFEYLKVEKRKKEEKGTETEEIVAGKMCMYRGGGGR